MLGLPVAGTAAPKKSNLSPWPDGMPAPNRGDPAASLYPVSVFSLSALPTVPAVPGAAASFGFTLSPLPAASRPLDFRHASNVANVPFQRMRNLPSAA